ncbi:MAG: DNA replication/repair protein RecF [Actinomycetia bacterium]|nr:DNA replication/repair protein RecF [Actinomycetes bacterium]
MRLSWLELGNFRPYEVLRFEPTDGVNILVGANGAGKTSVLEAIGYLGMMRSFRGVPDAALVRDDADAALVRGGIAGAVTETKVECEIPASGRRTILVNQKRPKRLTDVLLSIPVVAFVPDDLEVIKRGPAVRRAYLDELSTRLWPQAGQDLTEYERSVRQRNALLKQEGRRTDAATLDVWDQRLSDAGSKVLLHRRALAVALQEHLQDAYTVVGGQGTLTWSYRSTWGSEAAGDGEELREALLCALLERRGKDMEVRTTTVGPHRDEPDLLLDGRQTRTRASQGEQRTVALALRIGAYRIIEEIRDHKPILLLDDVFSELDMDRAQRVVSLVEAGQVFVTTARDDEVPIRGRRWLVKNGSVT